MSEHTNLELRVARWLMTSRERVASVAKSAGFPFHVLKPVAVFHFNDHTRGQGGVEERTVSVMKDWRRSHQVLDRAHPVLDNEAIEIAHQLVEAYGETVRFFLSFGPLIMAQHLANPTLIVEESNREFLSAIHLLDHALLGYLHEVPDLAQDDVELAQRIALELVGFASGRNWTVLSSTPVGGVAITEPAEVGNTRVRQLTSDEAGQLAGVGRVGDLESRFGTSRIELANERVVIEVRSRVPKAKEPTDAVSWKKAILAFQLSGFDISGSGRTYQWVEPEWINFGRLSSPAQLMKQAGGEPRGLDHELLEEICGLARLIDDRVFESPTRPLDVALHRFSLAAGRPTHADSLIDSVVTLEGLLLPGGDPREMRFRFSLNGAVYLEADRAKRLALRKHLAAIYDMRSKVVHGGSSPPDQATVHSLSESAYSWAREGLVKALINGWPTQDDFFQLLLG